MQLLRHKLQVGKAATAAAATATAAAALEKFK